MDLGWGSAVSCLLPTFSCARRRKRHTSDFEPLSDPVGPNFTRRPYTHHKVREAMTSSIRHYQVENRNRLIVINRTDDRHRDPPSGSEWRRIPRSDYHSKRWRGGVGTLVAGLCGWNTHDGDWHLADWPSGYSFWRRTRVDGKLDYYLYGAPTARFESPIEFVLHAFYLFSDKEHARPTGCRCCRCTKRSQGEVNRVEFQFDKVRKPPHRPNTRVGGRESLGSRGGSGAGAGGGGGSRTADEILEILQSIGEITRPASVPDRKRDRLGGQKFRIGEIVWISIPTIRHPARQDVAIKFWPAIIRDHQNSVNAPPNPPKLHHSQRDDTYDEYDVKLLGVGQSVIAAAGELLPYQAHWWSPPFAEELDNARPTVDLSSRRMNELSRFRPISQNLNAYSDALAPLALGQAIARAMSEYHSLTDKWPYDFTAEDGSAAGRFQGCWIGPERIWQNDYVRITKRRDELAQEPWHRRLQPPSAGSEMRGVIMEVRYFADEDGSTFVGGYLHEIANHTHGPLHMGPLDPLPPNGYKFRLITPDQYEARLPLSYLAGRYDYTTVSSLLTPAVLGHPAVHGSRQAQDVEGEDERRLLALSSMVPGAHNTIKAPKRWEGERDELLRRVEREVKEEFYERWQA